MAVIYDNIENYERYKSLFYKHPNTVVQKTNYTIKIKQGKKTYMLKPKEDETYNQQVLNLISKVRSDAINYLNGVEHDLKPKNDIFWSAFNEETGIEELDVIDVAKIDLTSAYWTKAINLGVLSKKTYNDFESIRFNNAKEKKKARLKALGSLATVKRVEKYEYGKFVEDGYNMLQYNEDTRDLYLYICQQVSIDMMNVLSMVNGIYYYWDCIFVDLDSIEKVSTLFSGLGYNFTVEKDRAEFLNTDKISYFYTHKNGVKYPIN